MNIFTAFGTEINYDDILQCDAAISKFHKLYGNPQYLTALLEMICSLKRTVKN